MDTSLPISTKTLLRFFVLLCLVLAISAAYFQAKSNSLQSQYHKLEKKYVQLQNRQIEVE